VVLGRKVKETSELARSFGIAFQMGLSRRRDPPGGADMRSLILLLNGTWMNNERLIPKNLIHSQADHNCVWAACGYFYFIALLLKTKRIRSPNGCIKPLSFPWFTTAVYITQEKTAVNLFIFVPGGTHFFCVREYHRLGSLSRRLYSFWFTIQSDRNGHSSE
jgi:hypothetical protein